MNFTRKNKIILKETNNQASAQEISLRDHRNEEEEINN